MIIVINTDQNTFVGRFDSVQLAEAAMAHVRFNPYFVGEGKDLESFSGSDLVSIYNSVSGKEPVKKFSTKGVALDRTWSALKNVEHVPEVKLDSGVGRCKYPGHAKIKLLKEECPRRDGTHGAANWALYRDGMTVADYLDALKESPLSAHGCKHFYWDVAKEFVEVEV
jgi:hypothetical protein